MGELKGWRVVLDWGERNRGHTNNLHIWQAKRPVQEGNVGEKIRKIN